MKKEAISISKPCNQQGFSLIQVMVSVAILSVVSMGYMQMTRSGLSSSKNIETSMAMISTVTEIGNLLGNSANCFESFKGLNLTSSGDSLEFLLLKRNDGDFAEKFKLNKSIGNSNISILSYQLSDNEEDVDVAQENSTYLYIEFDRGKIVNRSSIKKKIKINLIFDSDRNLTGCYSAGYGIVSQNIVNLPASDSNFLCPNTGSIRFDISSNSLQVCGADNIWYKTLAVCPAGAVKTCPSDNSIFNTCTSLGLWSGWTGHCDQ